MPDPAPSTNTTGGSSGCRAWIVAHALSSAATIGEDTASNAVDSHVSRPADMAASRPASGTGPGGPAPWGGGTHLPEQSQQAGWAAFDAGYHDIAKAHYRRGHDAAAEAGDAGLAGNALAFHAYQLLALDKPARDVSEQSVRAAEQDGVDPGVRALLYSRAAWTFALDGDADTTARCLGLAEDALTAATGETPDYAAWIDANELAIMTGRCWSELHRPLRAVPVLENALSRYSDAHARDKALYSSWLADSYLDAGEVEQAVNTVRSSLAVMGDVASVRPRQRLAAVARRLAPHRDLPVVADLLGSHALHPLDVRR